MFSIYSSCDEDVGSMVDDYSVEVTPKLEFHHYGHSKYYRAQLDPAKGLSLLCYVADVLQDKGNQKTRYSEAQ